MSKLNLNLSDLNVESFSTDKSESPRGTVKGQTGYCAPSDGGACQDTQFQCETADCPSPSDGGTCYDTCDTCGVTCGSTCYITCGWDGNSCYGYE
jgi:hypothetical protein